MRSSSFKGSETLVTFGFFRKKSPALSMFLIVCMALSVFGMAVFSMIERQQLFLVPVIILIILFWSYIYITTSKRKLTRLHSFGPRALLLMIVGVFMAGVVRDEPSITAILFIFPFILITFLSVPAKEAALWSLAGIASIFGVIALSDGGLESLSGVQLTASNVYVFLLAVVAQLATTFLLNGSARATAAVAQDRRRSLVESNNRYETLFENIDEGLVITDSQGVINFINRKGQDLLLRAEDDLVDSNIHEAVVLLDQDGEPLALENHPFKQAMNHQARATLDFTSSSVQYVMRGDGSSFRVAYSVSPVLTANRFTGTIFLFRDLTELSQMDRAKTEFVSLASHQLRTPLSVISWYTEKLVSQKKGSLNERQQQYVSEIESSHSRMIRLVNDLLSVSRAELGKVKVSGRSVDVRGVMQHLYSDVYLSAKDKSIKMQVTLEEGETVVRNSDDALVEAIVQNLLTNAIKYSPTESTIKMHLAQMPAGKKMPGGRASEESGLILSVQDSGVGIPKDQQAKIFTKMFRAENVQSMNVDGTGLGLYLSKKFSQALGGILWFDSAEDVGTTFYLFLPIAGREKIEASSSSKEVLQNKRRKEIGELFA